MALPRRIAIAAATSAACGFIAAVPAAADTYAFVNSQTGQRFLVECDTDPRELAQPQQKRHCQVAPGQSAAPSDPFNGKYLIQGVTHRYTHTKGGSD